MAGCDRLRDSSDPLFPRSYIVEVVPVDKRTAASVRGSIAASAGLPSNGSVGPRTVPATTLLRSETVLKVRCAIDGTFALVESLIISGVDKIASPRALKGRLGVFIKPMPKAVPVPGEPRELSHSGRWPQARPEARRGGPASGRQVAAMGERQLGGNKGAQAARRACHWFGMMVCLQEARRRHSPTKFLPNQSRCKCSSRSQDSVA